MKPVSTGLSPRSPAITVRAWPPRRGSASKSVTAAPDRSISAAAMPEMPPPITATVGRVGAASNGMGLSLAFGKGYGRSREPDQKQIRPRRGDVVLIMMARARIIGRPVPQYRRLRRAGFPGQTGGMETREPNGLSEQTVWMLAVRDAGDREAFARLFDFYAPRLKAMAMRGGTPGAVAEDIVQDVMLKLWRNAAQFDPARAQVSSWIYQIARNRRIDIARREPEPLPEDLAAPSRVEDTAAALALEQEVERLRAALDALPAAQREMVDKAYLGELTHQEISRQTSLPLGTVKSRLRRAIDRLRHELRELRK